MLPLPHRSPSPLDEALSELLERLIEWELPLAIALEHQHRDNLVVPRVEQQRPIGVLTVHNARGRKLRVASTTLVVVSLVYANLPPAALGARQVDDTLLELLHRRLLATIVVTFVEATHRAGQRLYDSDSHLHLTSLCEKQFHAFKTHGPEGLLLLTWDSKKVKSAHIVEDVAPQGQFFCCLKTKKPFF